jgi:AAA domain
VLVVDEAAMTGTRELEQLISTTVGTGGRVILAGDHRQLPEITAGGGFTALANGTAVTVAELTVNRRQQYEWERQALEELRDGHVAKAVHLYREHDRVHTVADPASMLTDAIDRWAQARATHANPKGVLWNIQNGGRDEKVWAGPSNAGLTDPGQFTLIALANVTIGLLGYAVGELMQKDGGLFGQAFALVKQQVMLALIDAAIPQFTATDEQQQNEQSAVDKLLDDVEIALSGVSPMTAGEIAAHLEIDDDSVQEALHAAVAGGRFVQQTRYSCRAAEVQALT